MSLLRYNTTLTQNNLENVYLGATGVQLGLFANTFNYLALLTFVFIAFFCLANPLKVLECRGCTQQTTSSMCAHIRRDFTTTGCTPNTFNGLAHTQGTPQLHLDQNREKG